MAVQYYEGIGRRKESTARVRVMSGSGKFLVNDKEAAAYFTRLGDMNDILMAFKACGEEAGNRRNGQCERRRCKARLTRSSWDWRARGHDQRRLDIIIT